MQLKDEDYVKNLSNSMEQMNYVQRSKAFLFCSYNTEDTKLRI